MSSVSAACIFGAYNASSAHTDTFYIVSQIVRVRNSKRHFFSKLTFHISFNRPASPYGNIDHSRPPSPYGNIDHSRSASPYGRIDHNRPPSPYGRIDHNRPAFTLRSHRPQPPCLHPTVASTTAAPLHPTATSTTAAPPSPYGNIDNSRSAFTLRQHRPQPLRFTLRQHRPQPLRFTLRQHRPQPPCLHSTVASTTTASLHPTAISTTAAPLHPTATSTTASHFAQQSRFNSSAENFSYFFKKALDKYPKTVYNIYCYLGVAQIGSALPWGGRGRRFKSCHSDQLKTA